ncbi:unnamed protein product [Linum trigynum]|uniref:Putative plant transposon protein domain-containing protein n=1 Tax=Linum trigynum TaxID=586398 RepID=A0AAV2DXB0_9ROSI
MAFSTQLSLIIARSSVFTKNFCSEPKDYPHYLQNFRHVCMFPSFTIVPSNFNHYLLRVLDMIHGLGWSHLLETRRFNYCPEAVRLFYVSMRRDANHRPTYFTTTVFGHSVTIIVQLISRLLGISIEGRTMMSEDDFPLFHFDLQEEIIRLSSLPEDEYTRANYTHVNNLSNDPKVLHFFITRVSLPRSTNQMLDVWILSNVMSGTKLSYPHLIFNHLLSYGDPRNAGYLSFAPYITRMLRCLGIDLEDKVSIVNVLDSLRAQHVLHYVNASVGVCKIVNPQGGERVEIGDGNQTLFRNINDDLAAVARAMKKATGASTADKGKHKLNNQEIMESHYKEEGTRPTTAGMSIKIRVCGDTSASSRLEA